MHSSFNKEIQNDHQPITLTTNNYQYVKILPQKSY